MALRLSLRADKYLRILRKAPLHNLRNAPLLKIKEFDKKFDMY